jgi:hypothetical protein
VKRQFSSTDYDGMAAYIEELEANEGADSAQRRALLSALDSLQARIDVEVTLRRAAYRRITQLERQLQERTWHNALTSRRP